jgi:hypothetical protein
MKAPIASLFLTAGVLAVAGCAATREQVTVCKPVGPVPQVAASKARPLGYLVAYTPVILPPMNSTTQFYPHSSYAIYDAHGALLQQVKNHVGAWDETPERIPLPPGRYTIHAQSDSPGELIVPILICGKRTTVVDLARESRYFVTAVNPG